MRSLKVCRCVTTAVVFAAIVYASQIDAAAAGPPTASITPVLAQSVDAVQTGPFAVIRPGGERNDDQTSIVYYANTGQLAVDAPAQTELTSILVQSDIGILIGGPAQNLDGDFDSDADDNIFKAIFGGSFGSISFGSVVPPHLPSSLLQRDLSVIGSRVGGGGLGAVDLIYVAGGQRGDEQTSIVYDARTGSISLDPPAGTELTSVRIGSNTRILTGEPAQSLGGDFDVDRDDRIFKATFDGSFGAIDFGNVAAGGLSESFLYDDLAVTATLPGGGRVDDFDLIYIPDRPSLQTGQVGDQQTSVIYDGSTGRIMLDAPATEMLSWISIDSGQRIFTQQAPIDLDGVFDSHSAEHLLKLTLGGSFGSQNFGKVAEAGLPEALLQSDLHVVGSIAGKAGLGDVDLVYIPGDPVRPGLRLGGTQGDGQTSVIYDANTGALSLDAAADTRLASVDIVSASGAFLNQSSINMDGPFDANSGHNLFKADFRDGFEAVSLGIVAPPRLSESFLAGDLTVGGSLLGGGGLGDVDLVFVPRTAPPPGIQAGGVVADDRLSVIYFAGTGRVLLDAPADTRLTSVDLNSASGVFTARPPRHLDGQFDQDTDDNIFKMQWGGSFGSLDFGKVAQPGLSTSFVQGDLSAVGTLLGDVEVSDVDLVYVPGDVVSPGIGSGGRLGDDRTSIVYNAVSGNLSTDAPAGRNLASIDIESASAMFIGRGPTNLDGMFDSIAPGNLFKADFEGGFGSLSFGNIARPKLPASAVRDDLTVSASLVGGEAINDVDLVYTLGGQWGDQRTSIVYYADTGEVAIDAPADTNLTSFFLQSSSWLFVGEPAPNMDGDFDKDADDSIFKATFGDSFGSTILGNVAVPGLPYSYLENDLTVIGTRAGGGGLGDVDLIYVPGSHVPPKLQPGGTAGDGQTSIIYDATTGRLSVDAPAETSLKSINLDSASRLFTGESVHNLDGPADQLAQNNLFKTSPSEPYGSLSLGRVVPPNLTEEFVQNDLSAVGLLDDGQTLGNVDLIYFPSVDFRPGLQPHGREGDSFTSIIYDADTGRLAVDVPADQRLASIDIISDESVLTGGPADNLDGPFDVHADSNIFKAMYDTGFGAVDFGNVARTGLAKALLQRDFTVVGTLTDGSGIGTVDLIYLRGLLAGQVGDGQTSIVYDAATGRLMVDAPAGMELTSIFVQSRSSIFTGQPADNLEGDFDSDADDNIFKSVFGDSFGSLGFGKVVEPGLSESFLRRDLSIDGSLADSKAGVGEVDLVYIPGQPTVQSGLQPDGQLGDGQTSIIFDATTGRISVDAPAGVNLASIDIESARGIFAGDQRANLDGPFDVHSSGNVYKVSFGDGFGSLSLGKIAETGLSKSLVQNDLTVAGSRVDQSEFGNVDLIYKPSVPPVPGLQWGGQPDDSQTSVVYFAGTGRVLLDAAPGTVLNSLDVDSDTPVFTGSKPQNLDGPFDTRSDFHLFKAQYDGGFGSVNFGKVAQPGLSESLLRNLTLVGILPDGRGLRTVDLVYLPGEEPTPGVKPGGRQGDTSASIIYDFATGELSLDVPADTRLSSIDIDSASGIFTGDAAENLNGVFDIRTDDNLFKVTFDNSFGSLTIGNVARSNLTQSFLLDDLTVTGTLTDASTLTDVDLVYLRTLTEGQFGDGQTSIVYDANTGRVMVEAPPKPQLTWIRMDSKAEVFTAKPAKNLGSASDVDEDGTILRSESGGPFFPLSFGKVAQPGLSESLVRGDLSIIGSRVDGRELGDVDLIYIPGGPVAPGLQPGGRVGDGQTSLIYYANSGRLLVDAPADARLMSVDIESAASIFTGLPAKNLYGPFDEDADDNLYKARFPNGFGSVSLGRVAQPGLSESSLRTDLTVVGSLTGGGNLGNTDLVYLAGDPAAAGVRPGGQLGDSQTSLVYFLGTGRVLIDVPAESRLTSIEIDSSGAIFTGGPAQNLDGPFDSMAEDNIFKADFETGFGSVGLGKVAQTILKQSFLQDDLTVSGSLFGDGILGPVDLVYIPGLESEPGVRRGGQPGDLQTSISYNAGTGELAIDAPAGVDLSWIDIDSASGIFTRSPAQNLTGPFDSDTDENLFKAILDDGFGALSFGTVATTRLSERFVQSDLTVSGMLATGETLGAVDLIYTPYAPPPFGGEQTWIIYEPNTGEISVKAPASTNLTSINIDSAAGIFVNHEEAQNLDGSFDTHSETNIFKATFGNSFGSISFGHIAQTGLSAELLRSDLTVIGSLQGGGSLGYVVIAPYIPEPPSDVLVVIASLVLIGLLPASRRRRTNVRSADDSEKSRSVIPGLAQGRRPVIRRLTTQSLLLWGGLALFTPGRGTADVLSFSFEDPVGDRQGTVDVTGLTVTFDDLNGAYHAMLTADEANPFFGRFRVNLNLFNPDVGTTAEDQLKGAPSFFQRCSGTTD